MRSDPAYHLIMDAVIIDFPIKFLESMVYSYVYSEQKYGKSEENLRGEAEEVF